MKIRVKVVVLLFVFAFMLEYCSTYRYCNKAIFFKFNTYDAGEELKDYLIEDEEYSVLLANVKEQLSPLREDDEFAYLNWLRFDNLDIAYFIDKDAVPQDNMCYEEIENIQGVYIESMNAIALDAFLARGSARRVMVHELSHALLCSDTPYTFIIEGETELLATDILDRVVNESSEPVAYFNGVVASNWLNDIFGAKAVRTALMDGSIDELLDEALEPGACYALDTCGAAYDYSGNRLWINGEIEVLCYLSRATGHIETAKKYVKIFESYIIDEAYFEQVLLTN